MSFEESKNFTLVFGIHAGKKLKDVDMVSLNLLRMRLEKKNRAKMYELEALSHINTFLENDDIKKQLRILLREELM